MDVSPRPAQLLHGPHAGLSRTYRIAANHRAPGRTGREPVGVDGVIRRSRGGTGAVEPPPELLDGGRDPAPGCGAGSGEDLRCDRAGDDLHRGAWRWTWV